MVQLRWNSNGRESNDPAALWQCEPDWVREELQAYAGLLWEKKARGEGGEGIF